MVRAFFIVQHALRANKKWNLKRVQDDGCAGT
jgi:hypothetical protein